ncbi:MAG: VOC family protein [Saprospiraceae bacterium]
MTSVAPYLNFPGNCMAAFDFYRSTFRGEFEFLGKFGEMPPGEYPLSEAQKDLIMHVSLPIGNGSYLLGSDTIEGYGGPMIAGNNFGVSITADTREEAKRLFDGLSAGGKVTMPMDDTFWGSYFGMFTDQFNINWMVSCESKAQKG